MSSHVEPSSSAGIQNLQHKIEVRNRHHNFLIVESSSELAASTPNSLYTVVSIGSVDPTNIRWSASIPCDTGKDADALGTLKHCQSGHIKATLNAIVPSGLINRTYPMKPLNIGWS